MSGDAGFLRGDYKGVDALVEQSMRIGGQAESSIEDMLARVQQELGPEGVYAQQRGFLQDDYSRGFGSAQTDISEQLKSLSSRYGQTGLLTGQQNKARDLTMGKGIGQLEGMTSQFNQGLLDIGQRESSTAWDAMSAINQIKSNALQSMPAPEYNWNYNPNTSFLDTWLGR